MPRTTPKKPPTKPRPRNARPAATATEEQAPSEAEHPAAKATGYAAGDLVFHPMFGDGTVTAVDANKLTIRFEGGRERHIVDTFVKRRPR
jgi:hypothetical protein